jgi:hypothetical protein
MDNMAGSYEAASGGIDVKEKDRIPTSTSKGEDE